MKQFKEMVESIAEVVYKITPKGRISQGEQNELKAGLTNALQADLGEAGIESYVTQQGIVIVIPNDMEGAIPVELNIITKPLDLDYHILHEEWQDKLKARAEKKKAKEKLSAKNK